MLSKNPKVYAKVEARLKKLAALEEGQKVDKEVADEGKGLLSRMPSLKALQELRKDYQALTDGKMTEKDFAAAREKLLAGMKLDEDSAESFAKKLIYAFETIQGPLHQGTESRRNDGPSRQRPVQPAEQKMPADIQERLAKAKEMSKSDLLDLLKDARMPLGKREDFDNDHDVELAIQAGIYKLVDPYTDYTDKEKVAERRRTCKDLHRHRRCHPPRPGEGCPAGGFADQGKPRLQSRSEGGRLHRQNPPRSRQQGRKTREARGNLTKGLKVQDAVKLIVGKPGTPVKVFVERPGEKEPKEYEINRGLVEVETVMGYKRKNDDSWDYFIDPKSKIAYIDLSQFSRNSFYEMDKAVQTDRKGKRQGLDSRPTLQPRRLPRRGPRHLRPIHRRRPDCHGQTSRRRGEYHDRQERIRPAGTRQAGLSVRQPHGFPDGLPDQRRQRQCQRNPFRLSARPRSGVHHGRAQFRQGQRAERAGTQDDRQKIDLGEIKMTIATFWRPNGKNLNKASTKGTEDEDWGVRPNKNGLIKFNPQETGQLADRLREWSNIPNREAKVKDPEKEKDKDFKDRQLEGGLRISARADQDREQCQVDKERWLIVIVVLCSAVPGARDRGGDRLQ